jgi:glycerate 2-kinase
VRVLAAPDKFKGTLSAPEAASAIAAGWLRARPDDRVERLPLADGGEGTLDALVDALGGERHAVEVRGPLGERVTAEFGLIRGPEGPVAVVEMARASGLQLVPPERRAPLLASTSGTGELILAACGHRPGSVVLCIGGSATTDGGAGMAQALGIRLLDPSGRDLPPGGAALADLDRIDPSGLHPDVRGVGFVVARDVDNPLTGPEGAAAVYGPQKGASPEDVETLDRALGRLADVMARDLGADVRDLPGVGAAGGLGAGVVAFLGGRLRPGIEVVLEAVGFPDRLGEVDLVLTGEGRVDAQSLRGKTAAGVMGAAREAGVPVVVFCGRADVDLPGATVASMADAFGLDRAMREAGPALEELAAKVAASFAGRGG